MNTTLEQAKNAGIRLCMLAAAMAAADSLREAYEAQHHLERLTNEVSELFDRVEHQELLGYKENQVTFRHSDIVENIGAKVLDDSHGWQVVKRHILTGE